MDFDEYRKRGKEMVDYIADYLQNIRKRRVFPDVSPGYMRALIPESAPERGEHWADIFRDVERVIMPGVTHWQSPHMHAYFPALNSFPSLLGDMLADAIGCLGFTWASSPACTELETITMDWLGKMIGLPTDFLHSNEQTLGGGVIQTTASECTLVSLLAARAEIIRKFKATSGFEDAEINARLICYCSDQAHSSVEKASLIGLVKLRFLPSDDNLSLRGETLREAIDSDREEGLIPFYLCATAGTTGACAFDNLKELGPICEEEGIWMHIDAAYAGSAFICPEFRKYIAGIEHAQSFAFNPSKWLMVHFDCSGMWLKNSGALHRTFNVDPLYLKHENSGAAIDYMHWQMPLSRRFRSLKLWFVLRSFGVEGLQKHIRKGVELAKMFEKFVRKDVRFEIPAERLLGMVVFRLKGDNELTEVLLKRLNKMGRVHMVPASLKDRYIIRFTVTSQYTTPEDIERDWTLIQTMADQVLEDLSKEVVPAEEAEEEEEEEEEGEMAGEVLAALVREEEERTKLLQKTKKKEDSAPLAQRIELSATTTTAEPEEKGSAVAVAATAATPAPMTTITTTTTTTTAVTMPATPGAATATATTATTTATATPSPAPPAGARRSLPALQRLPSLKKKEYGISLVLSNVPMSPKVINGSFAALFESSDITAAFARHFHQHISGVNAAGGSGAHGGASGWSWGGFHHHALRLSPRRRRGRLGDQTKQLSLDCNLLGSSSSSAASSGKHQPVVRFKQASLDSRIDDILEVSSVDGSDIGANATTTINPGASHRANNDDDEETYGGRRAESIDDLDLDNPSDLDPDAAAKVGEGEGAEDGGGEQDGGSDWMQGAPSPGQGEGQRPGQGQGHWKGKGKDAAVLRSAEEMEMKGKKGNGVKVINGVHAICRHCGMPTDEA